MNRLSPRSEAWSARLAAAALVAAFVGASPGAAFAQAAAPDGDPEDAAAEEPVSGVLLGDFFVRNVRGAENLKTRLSFSLYAAVPAEREAEFRDLLEGRRHRVRDQVMTAVRLTETAALQEPSLARLKRRVLLRLRRTMPELKIDGLHFGAFTLLFE